jgi:hypothetical protein
MITQSEELYQKGIDILLQQQKNAKRIAVTTVGSFLLLCGIEFVMSIGLPLVSLACAIFLLCMYGLVIVQSERERAIRCLKSSGRLPASFNHMFASLEEIHTAIQVSVNQDTSPHMPTSFISQSVVSSVRQENKSEVRPSATV